VTIYTGEKGTEIRKVTITEDGVVITNYYDLTDPGDSLHPGVSELLARGIELDVDGDEDGADRDDLDYSLTVDPDKPEAPVVSVYEWNEGYERVSRIYGYDNSYTAYFYGDDGLLERTETGSDLYETRTINYFDSDGRINERVLTNGKHVYYDYLGEAEFRDFAIGYSKTIETLYYMEGDDGDIVCVTRDQFESHEDINQDGVIDEEDVDTSSLGFRRIYSVSSSTVFDREGDLIEQIDTNGIKTTFVHEKNELSGNTIKTYVTTEYTDEYGNDIHYQSLTEYHDQGDVDVTGQHSLEGEIKIIRDRDGKITQYYYEKDAKGNSLRTLLSDVTTDKNGVPVYSYAAGGIGFDDASWEGYQGFAGFEYYAPVDSADINRQHKGQVYRELTHDLTVREYSYIYDEDGNKILRTEKDLAYDDSASATTYHPYGHVLQRGQSSGMVVESAYVRDNHHNIISEIQTTVYEDDHVGAYDQSGTVSKTTSIDYDIEGNVILRVDAQGNESNYTYVKDSKGNIIQRTETLTLETYDATYFTGTIEPLVTVTQYNEAGDIITVTNNDGEVIHTTYERDSAGRDRNVYRYKMDPVKVTAFTDATFSDYQDNTYFYSLSNDQVEGGTTYNATFRLKAADNSSGVEVATVRVII